MAVRLNPYLVFDGNTREAVEFYVKVLEAEVIGIQTFGDMPANPEFPLPEDAKGRISHAMIKAGDTELMFSDTFPGQPLVMGNHVSICITVPSVDKANRIYAQLEDGGEVLMPLQETFWSPAYGTVKDRFGVVFHVTTETNQAS